MRSNVSLQTRWPCSTMNGTSCARTSSAARDPLNERVGVVAEPGIEEARVVGAQLSARRVVRRHLRREHRRDAHGFVAHQEIEPLRSQHDAVAVLALDRFPERFGVHRRGRGPCHVEQRRVVAGAVADPTLLVAAQIETEEQAAAERELVVRNRLALVEQQRLLTVERRECRRRRAVAAPTESRS